MRTEVMAPGDSQVGVAHGGEGPGVPLVRADNGRIHPHHDVKRVDDEPEPVQQESQQGSLKRLVG